MPFVEQNDIGGFVSEPLLPKEKPAPGGWATLEAGFRMENDVYAAYNLLTRQNDFKPTAGYNVVSRLKDFDTENRTNLFENYKENFIGVRSEEEFQSILRRINQEQADRETLEAAGAGGVVTAIAAGVLSPTMFLPFVGSGKGVAVAGKAALMGGVASAAQEIPLQLAQETRTLGESAFAISAGTIAGGLLGGAVSALRKGEYETILKAIERDADMVRTDLGQAISTSSGSVGAAFAQEYAGKLKGGAVNKLTDWLSPVTRVINQDVNRTMSWAMSQLSDAGLRTEGNLSGVATSAGGTVEARVKTYNAPFAEITKILDNNYAKYVFGEDKIPGFAPNVRAAMSGWSDSTKLSKHEFKEEISRALREGDTHVLPEVAAVAQAIRTKIFDPILREAQNAGIYKDINLVGDTSYLHRVYSTQKIKADTVGFVNKLANHYAEKLNEQFGEDLARLEKRTARDKQLIEDLARPKEEVAALRETLMTELKAVNEGRNADIVAIEDQIAQLRSNARLAAKAGDEDARKAFLSDARQLERSAAEDLGTLKAQRAELRSRLYGLSRAAVVLEERQAKKLAQIEKFEDIDERQLMQVSRAGQRVLNALDSVSDKELDKLVKSLENDFTELLANLEKSEAKLAKLVEDETVDISTVLKADETVQAKTDKLHTVAERLEEVGTIDRAELRAVIMDGLNEVNDRVLRNLRKRAIREDKLAKAAEALDPAQVAKRVDGIRSSGEARRLDFIERTYNRGGSNIDLNARTADFMEHATTLAESIKDRIMGTNVRIPLNDIMAMERGPELARVLDIPSSLVEDYLENDIERVLRTYLRTLPADIEIKKKFGDINGTEIFNKATEELNNKLRQLSDRAEKENWPEGKLKQMTSELNDKFKDLHRDLEVVLGRLRGTHGLPDNPDGMAYRMAKTVMNLNVLRLMGGTLISSLVDPSRVIQRYGLTRTFRDGFVPLVTNLKQVKMSVREARLAGAALDAIIHTRAQSVHDVMDDLGRHSKFERGVEFMSNRMGTVALFDQWTTAMKQFAASVIITKITDSLDIVVGGAKASAKEVAEAQEFLAAKGLVDEHAVNIYKQLTTGEGGARVNNVLMPNTEKWTDEEAKRVFRQALVSEVDHTIITPGVERPTFMTSSTMARVLTQFKSFGMTSTFKVLAAGLQQRDMAFFGGTMVSLALGALSYYLYAVAAGGETYEKMLKGGKGKFADEAISRSGLLGVFAEAQRFAERIPATKPFVSFSGDRTTRRGGDDLMDVILGPSMSAAKNAAKVLQNIDEPTKSTLHSIRTLVPYQNLILWRQILDKIEAANPANLPERRS